MKTLLLTFLLISINTIAQDTRHPRYQEYGTIKTNAPAIVNGICTPWTATAFCVVESGNEAVYWERTCDNYLDNVNFCSTEVNPNQLESVCTAWTESKRSSCPEAGKKLYFRECQDVRYMTTKCE